jgi:hypothetical protein
MQHQPEAALMMSQPKFLEIGIDVGKADRSLVFNSAVRFPP